ncbi:butyrophilin subfamily 1 member A1-like [Narcine bancroftii]|uniref:butyrophilin subfamily 1 member A1-like n=1 Tax=Narcine bancroftii TaxID=1343680 RepID=UPI00383226C6
MKGSPPPAWSLVMKRTNCIVIFLLLPAGMMGKFAVMVPGYPTVVLVGDDAVLDCQLVPHTSLDGMEVRWFTSSPDSPVHLHTGRQDQPDMQDRTYRGRTELFQKEFPYGNASLQLKRVKVSDRGNYTCSIKSTKFHVQAVITLQVEGLGKRPWIHLEPSNWQGVHLVCKSDGWYPQPDVWWVDGGGGDVTHLSDTRFIRDSTGTFTVQSHLDVTSDSVNKYSCIIQNHLSTEPQAIHLHIADEFFPKVDVWLVIFWVFASLVVIAAAFNEKIHRREDKDIKELQLFCSLEGYKEVRINYASISLDVDTAHQRLKVSKDGKSVTDTGAWREVPNNEKRFMAWFCVLGSEGFASGKHYWEVEVTGNRGWRLGVAAESVARKDVVQMVPENGFWSIRRLGNEFCAFTIPETNLRADPIPQKVGVYLSYESGTIMFYGVDTRSHLHTYSGNSFSEKLYPLIVTWDTNKQLHICSRSLTGSDLLDQRQECGWGGA